MEIRWNFECIEFIKEIAKGFNPITGEKFSEADTLRASDVVGRLEDFARELEKDYFCLLSSNNSNSENNKPLSESIKVEENLTISQIAENINEVIPLGKTKITKLLTNFLISNGYLAEILQTNQKKPSKLATKKGEEIGITNVLRQYDSGKERLIAVYSIIAQKFIFENLRTILND